MKISVGNFAFSGANTEEVDGLRIGGQRAAEISQLLRAKYARIHNRDNEVTRFGFRVTRTHDSLLAAQKFLIEHPRAFPRSGVFSARAYATGSGGEATFSWEENDVCVESWDGSHEGVTTFFTYNLVVGLPKGMDNNAT
jgi:hypothetical protein